MSDQYKIAIVVLVDGSGNILMIRRVKDDENNGGKWEFPAGHIDGGERPEIAAVREVFEETGLNINLMPWSIDVPTKVGKAAQFLGFVTNGDIKPEPDLADDEHDKFIWIKPKDLSKVKPTHKNMDVHLIQLLKKIKSKLSGNKLKREATKTGQSFSGKFYRGIETDIYKARRDRIPAQFAVGEYWTDNLEIAETYGDKVVSRDIVLTNPYVLKLGDKAYYTELIKEFGTKNPREITNKLVSEGYDGLIVKNVPLQRRKPNGEYVVMRDSTEYILFNRRTSSKRRANELLQTRIIKRLPESWGDLREAILVGDEVEIFLKDQAYRKDNPDPDISGIVDRRNRNTIWIRSNEEAKSETSALSSPLMWKNDGKWSFIRVYRDPDKVIHYIKGNPYDPDKKTVDNAKGLGLIVETNPPDRFESVFALMRGETPDLDRAYGQAPQSFDEVAPFNEPRPGIPPILHRVREVLRNLNLEPDLVDYVGSGRVLILTQDSDMKKDIVRVLNKSGVEVKAGRRGDLIIIEGNKRIATGVGGTTTIPIETDDELMRSTVVQREQRLKRERDSSDVTGQAMTGQSSAGQTSNPSQAFTPNFSVTLNNPVTEIKGLQKYGQTQTLPGNQGIKMTFENQQKMDQFKNDMRQNPMFTQLKSSREKRRAASYFIRGFRKAMVQGNYDSAGDFLGRLVSIGIREESIARSRLASKQEWKELSYYADGIGQIGISRISRKVSKMAPSR